MLELRAMGSGISESTEKSILVLSKSMKGMPRTKASIRFRSVSVILPSESKTSPIFCFFSSASLKASAKSDLDTSPESTIYFFSCSSLITIKHIVAQEELVFYFLIFNITRQSLDFGTITVPAAIDAGASPDPSVRWLDTWYYRRSQTAQRTEIVFRGANTILRHWLLRGQSL